MKIREGELLARLRALGTEVRAGAAPGTAGPLSASEDAVSQLGLPERELTPGVRAALRDLMGEITGLREQIAAMQARGAELERLADEDTLVPIRNRRAFLRELGRTIDQVERYGTPWGLLYFDVDGLKAINDRFGHGAGDAALIHVADVLTANVRRSDVVGRLGGDEFGVLLARADQTVALSKAQGLASAIASSEFLWEGAAIPLSVAYGTHALAPSQDAPTALAIADSAMYHHKRTRVPLA